jgi:NAD(P)-dependent dehydrogenase (short-subunit alcohol dehydrogenase family)
MTSLDLFRLDGQRAVVTGGAGGLGAAIARGLAEAGAAVCVADEAKDLDEAYEIASRFPPATIGVIEVRQVRERTHS